MKKRISFLIAVIMVLSMLPAMTVSAASDNKMTIEGGNVSSNYCWAEQLSTTAGIFTGILPILELKNSGTQAWVAGSSFRISLSKAEFDFGAYYPSTTSYGRSGILGGAIQFYQAGGASVATSANAAVLKIRESLDMGNSASSGGLLQASASADRFKVGSAFLASGDAAAMSYDIVRMSDTTAEVRINNAVPVEGTATAGAGILYIPLLVKMTDEGAAEVTITDAGTSGINTGTYKIAQGVAGATTTTASNESKTFSTTLNVGDITITENRPGTVKFGAGEYIEIAAPYGFEWGWGTTQAAAFMGFGSITPTSVGFEHKNPPLDKGVLRIRNQWSANGGSSTNPGTIIFRGLTLTRTASRSEINPGDVNVTISGAGVSSQTFRIGVYADRSVSLTAADKALPEIVKGVFRHAGDSGADAVLEVTLTESSVGTWNESVNAVFELTPGVKFRGAKITSTSGIDTTDSKVVKDKKIVLLKDQAVPGTLVANQQGVDTITAAGTNGVFTLTPDKLTIRPVRQDAGTPSAKNMTLKLQLYVTIDPAFEGGDIELMTHEDNEAFGGEASVVVAKAIDPVTVTAATTPIQIGYMNIAVGDIVIKENVAGALLRSEAGNNAYASNTPAEAYLIGIGGYSWQNSTGFFKGKGEMTVTDGDILFENYRIDSNRYLVLEVKRQSTVASEIKLSGLTMDADRSLPEGKLELRMSGMAAANYRGGSGGNPVNSNGAAFSTSYITLVKEYIDIITSAPDKSTKFTTQVAVPIGTNKVVVNGEEREVDATSFVEAGRTMVPVRAVSEALGIENITYDWETQTVTINDPSRIGIAQFKVGVRAVRVNGTDIPYSATGPEDEPNGPAPILRDGRTYLPFRVLGSIVLQCPVSYDAATQTAYYN